MMNLSTALILSVVSISLQHAVNATNPVSNSSRLYIHRLVNLVYLRV